MIVMNVLGIGGNAVDYYMQRGLMYAGGSQLNFAVYAKMLNIKNSAYMGVFGSDEAGIFLKNVLINKRIDISRCTTKEGDNCAFEIEINNGERIVNLQGYKPGVMKNHPLIITKEDLQYIEKFDFVHTMCWVYMDDNLPLFKDRNFLLSYDFSVKSNIDTNNDFLCKIAPTIDFAIFSCSSMNYENINSLIQKTHNAGTPHVLVTMGKEGQIFSSNNIRYNNRAKKLSPKDTLGAGDAFIASFAVHMLQSGWTRNTTPNDKEVKYALKKATDFSSEICMLDGAFSCSCRIPDSKLRGVF